MAVGIQAELVFSDNCINGPKWWKGAQQCSDKNIPDEKCFMSVPQGKNREIDGECRELPKEYDI